ncbi:alpha/beta hydrolase [Weeksellaceae bacterium TAE3-ERU29]|nr:alpha/beta hydrolase [Weeksellaceae bacterium TAE3-ERU29]
MKIFAISGLGADERVFEYLTLRYELISVKWIKPNNNETIEEYSKRLVQKYEIGSHSDFGLLGVSFGGLVATEIAKITQPKFTILISSIETRNELNGFLRLVGKTKLLKIIPKQWLNPPKAFAHFMFGAKNKSLLNEILDDTDLEFAKWAVNELVNWKNECSIKNIIKIGGSNDKLLSPKGRNTIIIDKGEHFMIVDKAQEISNIINENLRKYIQPN